jgi:hypothetical protein
MWTPNHVISVSRRLRFILRLLLVIAMGPITTVLVAWTIALCVPAFANQTGTCTATAADGELDVARFESWGGIGFVSEGGSMVMRAGPPPPIDPPEMRALVPPWAFDRVVSAWDDPSSEASKGGGWWCFEGRGFPSLALWCAYDDQLNGTKPTAHGAIFAPTWIYRLFRPSAAASILARALTPVAALPCRPIWRGFLIDTIAYAFAWGLVLFGFPALRRWNRLRRNHCPHCNYNLAGLAMNSPCPECGKAAR